MYFEIFKSEIETFYGRYFDSVRSAVNYHVGLVNQLEEGVDVYDYILKKLLVVIERVDPDDVAQGPYQRQIIELRMLADSLPGLNPENLLSVFFLVYDVFVEGFQRKPESQIQSPREIPDTWLTLVNFSQGIVNFNKKIKFKISSNQPFIFEVSCRGTCSPTDKIVMYVKKICKKRLKGKCFIKKLAKLKRSVSNIPENILVNHMLFLFQTRGCIDPLLNQPLFVSKTIVNRENQNSEIARHINDYADLYLDYWESQKDNNLFDEENQTTHAILGEYLESINPSVRDSGQPEKDLQCISNWIVLNNLPINAKVRKFFQPEKNDFGSHFEHISEKVEKKRCKESK